MINKILNKFGYYKFRLPAGTKLSKAEVMELFAEYGKSQKFLTLLRDMSEQDKSLGFQASNDFDRFKLMGAWERNQHFISMILKAKEQNGKH